MDTVLDDDWISRNEGALLELRQGRYAMFRARLELREDDGAPFGETGAPSDGDEVGLESPTPLRHFKAEPIAGTLGVIEVVLLPSGAHREAPPVAYVWRVPEELAYETHRLLPPPGRTRIVGVFLQGEAVALRGAVSEVWMVTPCAWVEDEERLRGALESALPRH